VSNNIVVWSFCSLTLTLLVGVPGRNAFLRREKNIVRKNQSKTVKGGDNSKCVN
jgi:hypothetical protein